MTGLVLTDGGREAAGFRGRAGDCVTRAIAIAAERPYREVYDELHAAIKAQRRVKDRKGSPRDGVPNRVIRRYLESMGWTWTPTMSIGAGTTVHLRADELPPGRLIVKLSGHVCAVLDGVVHDTHDPRRDGTRCVYGYWQLDPDAATAADVAPSEETA